MKVMGNGYTVTEILNKLAVWQNILEVLEYIVEKNLSAVTCL